MSLLLRSCISISMCTPLFFVCAGIPTTATLPEGATASDLAQATGHLHQTSAVPRPGVRVSPARGRAIVFWYVWCSATAAKDALWGGVYTHSVSVHIPQHQHHLNVDIRTQPYCNKKTCILTLCHAMRQCVELLRHNWRAYATPQMHRMCVMVNFQVVSTQRGRGSCFITCCRASVGWGQMDCD